LAPTAGKPTALRYHGGVPPGGKYTHKQGQYLAFIYYYTKIHRVPPAEAEMQRYFVVTPPAVHQMILGLEEHGLITRTPGAARSIRLTLPRSALPDLE
jgi:repressor LexA